MYSDVVTDSMKLAIEETNRRREIQRSFNQEHGITPKSVKKNILDLSQYLYESDALALPKVSEADDLLTHQEIAELIESHTKKMVQLADDMEFEKAAVERDRLTLLKEMDIGVRPPSRSALTGLKPRQEQRMIGKRAQPRKYRRRR